MTNSDGMELEAKVAVDNPATIEDRLSAMGATAIGKYTEIDTFFDFPDRRLKKADSALRLRDRQDVENSQNSWRLTFKGPCQPGPFKHRREIEFAVGSLDKTAALLEAIGLMPVVHYAKERHSWKWRDCIIEVDTLAGIGHFLEVEGPNEERIRQVLCELNLADKPMIRESYLALAIRHGIAKNF
jgi:adenylate cyclase class 2